MKKWSAALVVLAATSYALPVFAAENATEVLQSNLNVVWTLVAAVLVFFMQAGFAMVEAGFTRAKNAVNIMMKNLMDFSIGSIGFLLVGFGLMFGVSNGFFGTTNFGLSGVTGDHWNYTFFIFQTVFCATAATIVSGAMAERTKFSTYLIYSAVVSMLIYPVFGSWAWGSLLDGKGWLEGMGFVDLAGSTVVHSVGGWVALAIGMMAGVIVVLSVLFIDRVLKVDDPVGAISVHGVAGAWGTLSAGLFNAEATLGIGEANTGLLYGGGAVQLGVQDVGVAAGFAWAFFTGLALFFILKKTVGLRVSKEHELKGLDLTEHGTEAYAGFQIYLNQ
jgi:ammonia channel protein AmtB